MNVQGSEKGSAACCIWELPSRPIFGCYGSKMYAGCHAHEVQAVFLYMGCPHPTKCPERTSQWQIWSKGTAKRKGSNQQYFYGRSGHTFGILLSVRQTLGRSAHGRFSHAGCVKVHLSNPHRFSAGLMLQKYEGRSHRAYGTRAAS